MAARYSPDAGDVVWLQFSPQSGHEQAGHRPAFVVSPSSYNVKVGLALMCPLTTVVKGYPFEVALPSGIAATGAILADQVKSLDWRARGAKLLCSVPPDVLAEVRGKIVALVGDPTDT